MTSVSSTEPRPLQAAVLRRATLADAQTLCELGARTFTESFGHLYRPQDLAAYLAEAHGLERVRTDLADSRKALWLTLVEGRAVGYALAGPCDLPHREVAPQDGELKRLYLVREAQNAGLGARLFEAALDWLSANGPRTMWIGVWSENFAAQRFYARRGFDKVGEYGFRVGESLDREFILRRRY